MFLKLYTLLVTMFYFYIFYQLQRQRHNVQLVYLQYVELSSNNDNPGKVFRVNVLSMRMKE